MSVIILPLWGNSELLQVVRVAEGHCRAILTVFGFGQEEESLHVPSASFLRWREKKYRRAMLFEGQYLVRELEIEKNLRVICMFLIEDVQLADVAIYGRTLFNLLLFIS